MSSTIDKDKLTEKLKGRMSNVEPLPDEPDFFYTKETLTRFLKARDWDLHEAEKQLKAAVEWRRQYRPLKVDCKWCHEKPGYHSMRQVGFDVLRRPVIYASFVQAQTHKNSSEDSLAHCVYLIENAKRSMEPGVSTWVFVLDCTGSTLALCNPKLGYNILHIMADHFPERLGVTLFVNHGPLFHGVWNAVKPLIHHNTTRKVKLIKTRNFERKFEPFFDDEMRQWLIEEIALNKQRPLPTNQRRFWRAPVGGVGIHDPRGTASYVAWMTDQYRSQGSSGGALPHPCIIDDLEGRLKTTVTVEWKDTDSNGGGVTNGAAVTVVSRGGHVNGHGSCASAAAAAASSGGDYDSNDVSEDDDDDEDEETFAVDMNNLPEEYQVPKDVVRPH